MLCVFFLIHLQPCTLFGLLFQGRAEEVAREAEGNWIKDDSGRCKFGMLLVSVVYENMVLTEKFKKEKKPLIELEKFEIFWFRLLWLFLSS